MQGVRPLPPEDLPVLQEYLRFQQEGLIGRLQLEIVALKISTHCTNAQIIELYHISCNRAIIHCLLRTIQGRFWEPGLKTGNNSYLSECDCALFVRNAFLACSDLNCLLTFQAAALAQELKRRRRKIAEYLLQEMQCLEYLEALEATHEPSRTWLKGFAAREGLIVCNSQQLELVRRIYCDQEAVNRFFDVNTEILQCDPRLLFNMDETSVSAAKRFRVLRSKGKLPITIADSKLPHLTAVLTVSAAGAILKPLIILPKLKSLKSLEQFKTHATFCSSLTGWMNADLFMLWVVDLCHQLSWYRRRDLPAELRGETIRIVIDGHPSRINFEAWCMLRTYNIALVPFPGHTTHVLQPIDVGVASPVKVNFKRRIQELTHGGLQIDLSGLLEPREIKKRTSDEIRCILVRAIIDAIQAGATRSNIQGAFKGSGIFPWDRSVPLGRAFVADPGNAGAMLHSVQNKFLIQFDSSFDENLQRLGEHTHGRQITDDDIVIDETQAFRQFQNERGHSNVLLSPISSNLCEISDGQFTIQGDQ